MSAFSSLSEFWQTMLPFIMLVEIVLEIWLFMYQLLRSNKPVRSLLSLAVMAVMIPLLFSVSQADPDNIGDAFLLDAPWLIFAAAIFLAAVHFAIALPREYRRKKNELSPFSIKEATDKLPMGICFADPNGRIILCNNRMRRLSFALCGHELQIKSDMENALSVPDRSVTVKDDCYILPDKTVWQFRAHTMERMLMQKLDDCHVVISESPDATAEWCKTHRPDVLLMEVKAYSPWMFKERMAIRDKVKRNTENCRVILFVDDDTDGELTEKVRQAKREGLIDAFLFGSVSENYFASVIDSV